MQKSLVVVAHPDDETIWCGGTILENPAADWTILSLCRKDDEDRAPRFRKACSVFGAKCAMSDLDDDNIEVPAKRGEIESRIRSMMKNTGCGNKFSYVYTHNTNGEYGHPRHKEVSASVRRMVDNGDIDCRRLLLFSYEKSRHGEFAVPRTRGAALKIALSDDTLKRKKRLIKDIYGFNEGSFEERSCSGTETFKGVR